MRPTTALTTAARFTTTSIPAPHAGGDITQRDSTSLFSLLQSTRPHGARPSPVDPGARASIYFNSRTPCGVRLNLDKDTGIAVVTSIHAPHAGCDSAFHALRPTFATSIHAPHTGCDQRASDAIEIEIKLQFTHLMRGATISALRENNLLLLQFTHPMRGTTCLTDEQGWHLTNFNPRTPCGARRDMSLLKAVHITTSIHALHAGRDETRLCELFGVFELQFTHPMRRATQLSSSWQKRDPTSIHAPHAGCDACGSLVRRDNYRLQSTHPAWGATAFFYNYLRSVIILLYICDKLFFSYAACFSWFLPRNCFYHLFAGANRPGKE